jgi:hypothetical protein
MVPGGPCGRSPSLAHLAQKEKAPEGALDHAGAAQLAPGEPYTPSGSDQPNE